MKREPVTPKPVPRCPRCGAPHPAESSQEVVFRETTRGRWDVTRKPA